MSKKDDHHNLSLKLLAGRSLPGGVPWTAAEERTMIAQERILWTGMDDIDREEEQKFLSQLWSKRGASRSIPVNPAWGDWAAGLGTTITLPDTAFGIPSQDFRPYPKGKPLDSHPGFDKIVDWLWTRGFQVVDIRGDSLVVVIPSHRVVQEAERMLALIVQSFPDVAVSPHGSRDGVQLRSSYDPVGGQAYIELTGIDDRVF